MALVELGRFNRQEAFIVQGRLEDEDIPSFVFDAGASIADGSYLLIPVRVMVDDDDLAAARAIVDAAGGPMPKSPVAAWAHRRFRRAPRP